MKKGEVVTLKSEYRDEANDVLRYGTRLTINETYKGDLAGTRFNPHPLYVTFDTVPDVENKNYYPASWFRTVDEDELR